MSRIAREIAQTLDEPKVRLLARAVDALGERACRAYASEARALQENGGEMTAAGDRKRTTGGLFWSIVRNRTAKETYDLIFAEERERSKSPQGARARARASPTARRTSLPLVTPPRWLKFLRKHSKRTLPLGTRPSRASRRRHPAPTLKSLGGGDGPTSSTPTPTRSRRR